MRKQMTNAPIVMSISNLDPSGGGGISADIETLSSLGCHCTPIISKLSARDTSEFKDSQITDSILLIGQIRAVLEDMKVDLIKISDLASTAIAEAVSTIITDYPHIPVVLHPNIINQDGEHLINVIRSLMLAKSNVVMLSEREALLLAPEADTVSACAHLLMESGCDNILITGADANNATLDITNHWYTTNHYQKYVWQRLPNSFLGAGSTLSAALSGYLAHGISASESIQQAQQFTWKSLQQAKRVGMGNLLPDRMHWCR
jgi:hydroxymethylpyrimidine/phosphomethylpyrimidine kinase